MRRLNKGLLIFFSICICLLTGCSKQEDNHSDIETSVQEIISIYEEGNYIEALEEKNKLGYDEKFGEYADKIELMGNLYGYYTEELKEYTCVLYYVGHYNDFEKNELVEIAYPMVKDAAQKVANYDLDIAVQFERSMENEEISKKLEPMLSEDKEKMLEVMEQIAGEIDYELADKEYEKYIEGVREDYQENYNEKNPLQITNDSIYSKNGYYYCNGTLKNVSSSEYTYIKIKVTYYDKDNNVLTTDWTYAVNSVALKGGENIQFEIMTKVDGDVESYKCEILE